VEFVLHAFRKHPENLPHDQVDHHCCYRTRIERRDGHIAILRPEERTRPHPENRLVPDRLLRIGQLLRGAPRQHPSRHAEDPGCRVPLRLLLQRRVVQGIPMSTADIYITGHIIQADASRKPGPQHVAPMTSIEKIPDLIRDYERINGRCASFDISVVH